MSNVAATRGAAPSSWSYAALLVALAAVVTYGLAGVVDDALYAVTGLLGVAAFGLGVKARREAERAGARRWPAIVALTLGGFLGALIIAWSIGYAIYHAV